MLAILCTLVWLAGWAGEFASALPTSDYTPASPAAHLPPAAQHYLQLALGQFAHLSSYHLLLNLTALALLTWGLATHHSARHWLLLSLFALLAVPAYLLWTEPLQWYMGLSGALHAQFTALLGLEILRPTHKGQCWHPQNARTHWPLWVLVAGLGSKLALEWLNPPGFSAALGGMVATQAHRGGVLVGLVWVGLFRRVG
ncbi:MAG: rhomboid family intramembrane serine protease [Limnobacter sp.]|nr:rhomboid family intramembrane serine protease [Limnobacter sp.]